MKWLKKYKKEFLIAGLFILIMGSIYSYFYWYIPHKHKEEGFVIVNSFDCPPGYPVKGHLGSMIYHDPDDPYYNRTRASNGYCFDTNADAEKQHFRASAGTPNGVATAQPISNAPYQGGYAPDGTFCDFGYNTRTKDCCDDDDYSCEVMDRAPKGATAVCVDETYSVSQNPVYDCSTHGGIQTDSQYSPFVN